MDAAQAMTLTGKDVTTEQKLTVLRQVVADFDAAIEGVSTLIGRPGYVVGWPQHSLWLVRSDTSRKHHIGGVRWAEVWQREADIPGRLLNAPNGKGELPNAYPLDYAAKGSVEGFRSARETMLKQIAKLEAGEG